MTIALDPTHLGSRTFLGWARIFHDYDWKRGMTELEAALGDGQDLPSLALYLRVVGRSGEARRWQARADALGAESGPALWHSMAPKYLDGRYAEVVEGGRKIQQVDPEHHIGNLIEAWGHIGLRDYPSAVEAIRRGRALYERQELHALLGYVNARRGERETAATVLRELSLSSRAGARRGRTDGGLERQEGFQPGRGGRPW